MDVLRNLEVLTVRELHALMRILIKEIGYQFQKKMEEELLRSHSSLNHKAILAFLWKRAVLGGLSDEELRDFDKVLEVLEDEQREKFIDPSERYEDLKRNWEQFVKLL